MEICGSSKLEYLLYAICFAGVFSLFLFFCLRVHGECRGRGREVPSPCVHIQSHGPPGPTIGWLKRLDAAVTPRCPHIFPHTCMQLHRVCVRACVENPFDPHKRAQQTRQCREEEWRGGRELDESEIEVCVGIVDVVSEKW